MVCKRVLNPLVLVPLGLSSNGSNKRSVTPSSKGVYNGGSS